MNGIAELSERVESTWAAHSRDPADRLDREAIEVTIGMLDRGEVRVAEAAGDDWLVHQWVKQAVLLYFRIRGLEVSEAGQLEYHDTLPLKHGYEASGVRVVPPATARYGSYLSRGVVLMPSYVNIGAWVGPDTMVDTWATVGSCAQIGAGVHLAGGVGIGGVLVAPPAQHPRKADRDARPVARRPCDVLEAELEDVHRFDVAHRPEAFHRMLPDPPVQLQDLRIRQP